MSFAKAQFEFVTICNMCHLNIYCILYIDLLKLKFNSIYSLSIHIQYIQCQLSWFAFLFLFKLVIHLVFSKKRQTKNMIQHSRLSEIRKNFLTLTPVNFVRILRFFFSKKTKKININSKRSYKCQNRISNKTQPFGFMF